MNKTEIVKPGDWTDLTSLPRTELVNRLLTNLDALHVCSNDSDTEDRAIAALPEPLRILYLLNWMDFEITQGTLTAYLFNSAGRHARAAADALRALGADALANVVDRAADVADSHVPAWDARHAELNALRAGTVTTPFKDLDGTTALDELTDEYWNVEQNDDWAAKLEAYLAVQAPAILKWAET